MSISNKLFETKCLFPLNNRISCWLTSWRMTTSRRILRITYYASSRWGDGCFTREGSAIYMGGTTSPDIPARERETILAREVPRHHADDKKEHSSKYVTRISQNTRLERRWGCFKMEAVTVGGRRGEGWEWLSEMCFTDKTCWKDFTFWKRSFLTFWGESILAPTCVIFLLAFC